MSRITSSKPRKHVIACCIARGKSLVGSSSLLLKISDLNLTSSHYRPPPAFHFGHEDCMNSWKCVRHCHRSRALVVVKIVPALVAREVSENVSHVVHIRQELCVVVVLIISLALFRVGRCIILALLASDTTLVKSYCKSLMLKCNSLSKSIWRSCLSIGNDEILLLPPPLLSVH